MNIKVLSISNNLWANTAAKKVPIRVTLTQENRETAKPKKRKKARDTSANAAYVH